MFSVSALELFLVCLGFYSTLLDCFVMVCYLGYVRVLTACGFVNGFLVLLRVTRFLGLRV